MVWFGSLNIDVIIVKNRTSQTLFIRIIFQIRNKKPPDSTLLVGFGGFFMTNVLEANLS